jgi:hypothetical protein
MAQRKLQVVLTSDEKDAVRGAKATEKAYGGLTEKLDDMGGKLQGVLAGVGIGGGLALADGLNTSFSREATADKLAAQLGASGQWAADVGQIAGNLYGEGFGAGMEDAAMGVRAVLQNGLVPEDATNEQIESITGKVMSLVDVFDQDLAMAGQAAGQMLRTGLAKDGGEALDILTRGMQQGADKAGDLLETFQEYGTQFRAVGINGAAATGLLVQGLAAGARDADSVADAIKEFADKAKDGSESSADAFAKLGLNVTDMAQAVANGGPEAAASMDTVLDRLRVMPASAERSAIAVALFGEKAIDLGDALYSLDPSEAAARLGTVEGAADGLSSAYDNNAASLEVWKRKAQTALAGFVDDNMPKLIAVKDWFVSLPGPVQTAIGVLGGLVVVGGGVGMVADKISSGFSMISSMAKGTVSGVSAVAGGVGRLRDGYRDAGAAQSAFSGKLGTLGGKASSAVGALKTGVTTLATWGKTAVVSAAQTVAHTTASVASKAAALAVVAAQKIWIGVQWALNAALTANPIGLVVAAIAALVAGVIWAYQNVGWFRDLVDGAFSAIQSVISSVVGWVTENWPLLLKILTGPIGFAVGFIIDHFDAIKGAFLTVRDWIWARGEDIVGFFTGLPGRIASVISTVAEAVTAPFRTAFNAVRDLWNNTIGGKGFDIPSWVPGVGGKSFRFPRFHSGGTFQALTPGGEGLAMLRDGERIVPPGLDSGAAMAPQAAPIVNLTVNVNGQGVYMDAKQLTEMIRNEMIKAARHVTGSYLGPAAN